MVNTVRIPHLIGRVMLLHVFGILILLYAWNSPPILAQGRHDIYTVKNLPVDVTAESAVKAREIAMLQGQRMAFEQMLLRISLRSDQNILPKLNDAAISQMVAAVAVANEKTSTVRYLANLTVGFHRTPMRQLLWRSNVRFSETRAKPTLVLPVFEKSAAQSLFEKNNLWYNSWKELSLVGGSLLPIILPLGDVKDITTITAQAALAGRDDVLQAIAQRYKVEKILVAHAIMNVDVSSGGLPSIGVNLLHFGPRGKSTEPLDYTVRVSSDLKSALTQLATLVTTDQQERWKRRTRLSLGKETSLSASLSLSDLSLWLDVRKRLVASSVISSFHLREISRQDAQVVINYLGDVESLVVSLDQSDLHLGLVEGYWNLRLDEGARAALEVKER